MSQDGALDQKEYDAYCQVTEAGAGCDDERWESHKKTLGAEEAGVLSLGSFSRLYSDEKMRKHYGHEQRDLDFARTKLAKAAAANDKAQLVRLTPLPSSLSLSLSLSLTVIPPVLSLLPARLCSHYCLCASSSCVVQLADFKATDAAKKAAAAAGPAAPAAAKPSLKVAGAAVVAANPKPQPKSKKKKKKKR